MRSGPSVDARVTRCVQSAVVAAAIARRALQRSAGRARTAFAVFAAHAWARASEQRACTLRAVAVLGAVRN